MKLKGSEIICESLLREGVEVVFGYPGGAILPLYDALWSYPQLRHILVRHEQAAAHAADGYSRVTGKVGVCMATSGPGATNLVTGIMSAKADSIPMVVITGQVARTSLGSEAFQECDICSITASCTKKSYMVLSTQDLAPTIREAFATAMEGRPGPVLIDVPRDVQLEEAEFEFPEVAEPASSSLSPETFEAVQRAARLFCAGLPRAHRGCSLPPPFGTGLSCSMRAVRWNATPARVERHRAGRRLIWGLQVRERAPLKGHAPLKGRAPIKGRAPLLRAHDP